MSVTTYDLGTVLMVPKGDWSSSVSYERLNLVRHNGAAWLCTVAAGQTSLNQEPSANSADWEILVQDESSVTSVNGQRGDVTIDESDYVHKSGTETITGNKTFSGTVTAVTPDEDDESTKVATTEWVKNTTLTNAVGSGANLFDVKWSDHRLNDMSWLRSDTFSWHNGEVYSAAYQELLSEYTNRSDQTIYKAFAKVSSDTTFVGSNLKEWRGIVQGFSGNTTNYITHPAPQATSNLEYVVKVSVDSLRTAQSIFGHDNTNNCLIFRTIDSSGNLGVWLSTNGSSFNIANGTSTGCTLQVGVWKWFKFIWNGSTFTISESLDGISYTQKYSVACTSAPKIGTTRVLGTNSASSSTDYSFTTGKFDLQECYLKVDGNYAWRGADFIEYAITDKKYRIALPSQAEKIKQSYDDYGIAWYYILDSTNTRFKLPRTKFAFTGLRSGVGDFVEAGLPNIAGTFGSTNARWSNFTIAEGAFYNSNLATTEYNGVSSTAGNDSTWGKNFDASLSNPQYGNSSTVQPPATEMYLYHYVGNFTRDAITNTAGLTSETINGKADADFSNVTNDAKEVMAHMGMPSDRYIGYSLATVNAENGVQAPADGYAVCVLFQNGVSSTVMYLMNLTTSFLTSIQIAYNSGWASLWIPVRKGDYWRLYANGGNLMAGTYHRFYYAEGSPSSNS